MSRRDTTMTVTTLTAAFDTVVCRHVEQGQKKDPRKKDWILSTKVSKAGRQRHKLKSLHKGRSSMTFDMDEYYATPAGLKHGEAYPAGDVLGHGTFGKVFVMADKGTGLKHAVKIISKSKWVQPEVTLLTLLTFKNPLTNYLFASLTLSLGRSGP